MEGYFSVDEVLFWLNERGLDAEELRALKNGEAVEGGDRNACFWYLGNISHEKGLIYYYEKIMKVKIKPNKEGLLIPEVQKKWMDQFLRSLLQGWLKSEPEKASMWMKEMKSRFKLEEL